MDPHSSFRSIGSVEVAIPLLGIQVYCAVTAAVAVAVAVVVEVEAEVEGGSIISVSVVAVLVLVLADPLRRSHSLPYPPPLSFFWSSLSLN